MKHSWAVAVLVAVPTVAQAGDMCTLKSVKAARTAGNTAMKAKHYADAIKALKLPDLCLISEDMAKPLQVAVAWQTSDLAAAQWKSGDPVACYATAEALLSDSPWGLDTLVSANAKLAAPASALRHNSTACHDAIVKARGVFVEASKSCGNQGAEVPSSMVPAGVKSQCLDVADSDRDEDSGVNECGAVTLTSVPVGKGKPTTVTLEVSGDNLTRGAVCCHDKTYAFQKRGPSWAVLVTTAGRDCEGGGPESQEEDVYKLDGKQLTSEREAAVEYH